MPCFLMDLRFATGREQKNRTFRFFFSGAALSLHVRSKSLGCQTAQIGTGMHRHCFPSAIAIGMCASARDEVGSVASGMCASAREETGSVASSMCASAIERY